MMDREIKDVMRFNRRFGMLVSQHPTHLTKRKLAERCNFLLEELRELAEAAGLRFETTIQARFVPDPLLDQNLPLQADALVDIVYVAKGTAVMMGLPWEDLWDDVQRCNMAKVPGATKRGILTDVTKPDGWVPPATENILAEHGYVRDRFLGAGTRVNDAFCLDDEVYR